jgi:anti-anti-sigma regulatory factor
VPDNPARRGVHELALALRILLSRRSRGSATLHTTTTMPSPPFFTMIERRPDGGLCLAFHGDLGYDTTAFARRAIARALGAARNVLIDLEGLERVDPFGLALLLKASRTSGVRITNLSPATREACRRTDTDLRAA